MYMHVHNSPRLHCSKTAWTGGQAAAEAGPCTLRKASGCKEEKDKASWPRKHELTSHGKRVGSIPLGHLHPPPLHSGTS